MAKTGPHGTPVRITMLVGVLVAIAASVFPMGKLEEMVNIGTLFAFVLVSARRDRAAPLASGTAARLPRAVGPAAPDRRDPGLPLADAQPDGADLDPLPIWMVIGVAVYWLYGRRHSVLAQRETATIK